MLQLHPSSRPEAQRRTISCKRWSRHAVDQTRIVCASTRSFSSKKAVVIGAGWAGLGAAYALSSAGAQVTVLETSDSPGGSFVASSPGGRVVEPGIKGFWYQYRNIDKLVKDLGIPSPFTAWTSSSFYSPAGLQVSSPIFQFLPRLPTPLGSLLYTAPFFTNLPLQDRLTAFPLLPALLEYDLDEATYSEYDRMSALELFRSAGVSPRLYSDFLDPILQVTLFAPGSSLSAAAALDALKFFALAHQADFDVRWCKGPIGTLLLRPLAEHCMQNLGMRFAGGRRVLNVVTPSGGLPGRVTTISRQGVQEVWEADAIVFAVGISAMQKIMAASPSLGESDVLRGVNGLQTLDVMALRLWLNKRIHLPNPSNVLASFERGVSGTVFDLSEFQDQYRSETCSVIEVDFYGAGPLLPLSDTEMTRRVLQEYLPVLNPEYRDAKVLDSCLQRYRGGVSAFTPGSAALMPPTVIPDLPGAYMAGDWIKQGPGSHGAKGLCQEKSYATGLLAGNAAAQQLGLKPVVQVLEPEPDELHVRAAREALGAAKRASSRLPRPPAWLPQRLGGRCSQ